MTRSTIARNRAGAAGGGIETSNTLTLDTSTISGNIASAGGGGIFNALTGTSTITNSTITLNIAGTGGGIENTSIGPVHLGGSIVAGNMGDMLGLVLSNGFNVVGDVTGAIFVPQLSDQFGTLAFALDPKLGPLADNGGPTPTHALLSNSPAIDRSDPAASPGTDQIGRASCRERV